MTRRPGSTLAAEVAEQPEVLERILADRAGVRAVAHVLREVSPRFVVLAARGTSDHAALYAKYLVEVLLGLPAGLASPSTMTAYGAKPDLSAVLFIAVSQSGASPDLLESVSVARASGACTLAVTNDPASPLAEMAELHLDVHAGQENAVAATKTYTAELLTLYLLIDAWRGGDGFAAQPLPTAVRYVLDPAASDTASAVLLAAQRWRTAENLVCTARGFAYATAREAALKVMETSYLAAQAFSGADLQHGPLALVDRGTPVVAVVPAGLGAAAMAPALECLHRLDADLLIVGDERATGEHVQVHLPDGLAEEVSPVVEIVPLQLLARELALARGLDPDRPRGLAKVTETW